MKNENALRIAKLKLVLAELLEAIDKNNITDEVMKKAKGALWE